MDQIPDNSHVVDGVVLLADDVYRHGHVSICRVLLLVDTVNCYRLIRQHPDRLVVHPNISHSRDKQSHTFMYIPKDTIYYIQSSFITEMKSQFEVIDELVENLKLINNCA